MRVGQGLLCTKLVSGERIILGILYMQVEWIQLNKQSLRTIGGKLYLIDRGFLRFKSEFMPACVSGPQTDCVRSVISLAV